MLALLVPYALAADCPAEPALRDPDGEMTVLAQNLKFIITGTKRKERDALFANYLAHEGAAVDVLLLSEARLTRSLEAWRPEWCFYTQVALAETDGYRWAPLEAGRPPAGLAMGIRQRAEGQARIVSGDAGRRYRARATSLAEGFLGQIFGFRKGWASLRIDDTQLVWSHTQASYKRRPERGAGASRRGRVGQFEDLAEDLGRPEGATLITGDLNLLAGFRPHRDEDDARIDRARAIDADTVARFRDHTGIDLTWPWSVDKDLEPAAEGELRLAALAPPAPKERVPVGTFAGGFDKRRADATWDVGAPYDRVGVNDAFLARHPGTRVRPVEIAQGWMRVSDHMGLEIAIPFARSRPTPVAQDKPRRRGVMSPRACSYVGEGHPRVGRGALALGGPRGGNVDVDSLLGP